MNIAAAQSGGPTCAINASLAGVFSEASRNEQIDKIYGSINGIEGIINDRLVEMSSIIKSNKDLELLKLTPSTVLGSCRFKLPDADNNSEVYEKIISCFKRNNIDIFFYIGGNDSMDTVCKLSEYFKKNNINVKVIGIPKTIDNDLMCTDHTPGFGSAAKYVAATVQEIARDSSVYSVKSVTVVEIMGRDAGWLTASTCVLKANDENAPHLIYLPETPFSVERFLEDVKRMLVEHNAVVVAVSEGLKLSDGEYAAEEFQSGHDDAFGHKYLSGIGKCLENIVRKEIGCKVRSIELNVMQRCASHMASKTDVDESVKIGEEAVKAAVKGETGKMMAFKRISDRPYFSEIVTVDAKEVANKERLFPKEWINNQGNNVTAFALDYFLPLIQGEVNVLMENGMPVHLKIPNWF
ncbi:6-phosphofructokinase [Porcipelethomonas sp.]|uniref:6-phosphofructokinase n=1 Tax=Porcipelethomonas sp. TaxID=2981675 RepID=UPI00307A5BDA